MYASKDIQYYSVCFCSCSRSRTCAGFVAANCWWTAADPALASHTIVLIFQAVAQLLLESQVAAFASTENRVEYFASSSFQLLLRRARKNIGARGLSAQELLDIIYIYICIKKKYIYIYTHIDWTPIHKHTTLRQLQSGSRLGCSDGQSFLNAYQRTLLTPTRPS